MVNINIQIPDDLHKNLKMQAVENDSTLKNLIVEKLSKYVRKNEKK